MTGLDCSMQTKAWSIFWHKTEIKLIEQPGPEAPVFAISRPSLFGGREEFPLQYPARLEPQTDRDSSRLRFSVQHGRKRRHFQAPDPETFEAWRSALEQALDPPAEPVPAAPQNTSNGSQKRIRFQTPCTKSTKQPTCYTRDSKNSKLIWIHRPAASLASADRLENVEPTSMEPTSIKPDVTIMSDHVEASDVIAIKIEEAEPENAKLEIIGDNTEELSVTEPSSNNVAGNFCVASLSHEIVDDDVFEVEAEGTHDESDVVIGDAADEVVISTATAVATVVVAAAASVGDESPDLGKALTTNEGIEKEEVVEPAVGDVGEGSVAAEVVLVGATSTGTLIGDAESIVAREVLPDGAEDANIEMEIDEEFVSPAVVISSDDTYKGGEASPEVGHDEEFEINLDAGRIVAASLGDKDSAEFIACTGAVAASDSDALISPVETYKWVPLDPYSSRLIWMRRLVLLSGDSSPSPKPSKKRAAPARKWLSVDPSSTRLIWIRRVECTARTNSRHKAAVNARTWVPLDPSSSRPIWVRRSVVPVGQHRH